MGRTKDDLAQESERLLLQRENERLREKLAGLEQRLGKEDPAKRRERMRQRFLDAAITVAHREGFQAELSDIAREVGLSPSAAYRYYPTKEHLIREVAHQARRDVVRAAAAIDQMDAPLEQLRHWMHCGFEMVRKYGILSAQISSGLIPREYREGINFEDLYRFTGRILSRCVERGDLEPKVGIREGVRFWFALVSPVRIQGCLDDGLSIEELEKQTLDAFLAVFSVQKGATA